MSDTAPRSAQLATEYVSTPLLADAVALFLAHRRNAGLSPQTIDNYAHQLTTWQHWRSNRGLSPSLADIAIDELRDYITYLQTEHVAHQDNPRRSGNGATLTPNTVASIRRVLRAAWNFWIDEELLSDKQATFFLRKRIPAPKVPKQIRQTYPLDIIGALLSATGRNRRPRAVLRDRAILLVLYDTGMRVAELCGLDDDDMNYSERQAIVHGKGGKDRYVFWTNRTTTAIQAYLAVRGGEATGPLFRGAGTNNSDRRLTTDSVRGILDRLAKKAGIDLVEGAPVHAIRHTFAHRFLDNGGDGLHLQQLMGHESMETTQRYVRENPSGLRRAYRRALDE